MSKQIPWRERPAGYDMPMWRSSGAISPCPFSLFSTRLVMRWADALSKCSRRICPDVKRLQEENAGLREENARL